MKLNPNIEKDISETLFFLKPKYFFSFFFFFFFRCFYAVLFYIIYSSLNKKWLIVNKSLISKSENAVNENILFIWDSTIAFPNQEYSFPYLYFKNMNVKNVDILAKPGLDSKKLYDYISATLTDKKYDKIFIACFMNEIIDTSINEEFFKKSTEKLINFIKKYLKKDGKIVYVYWNISLHPIVPNNYFKDFFDYKTKKFIDIVKKYEWENFKISLLMNFWENETKKDRKKYFYKDWLHFSEKWQMRLFEDLVKNLNN